MNEHGHIRETNHQCGICIGPCSCNSGSGWWTAMKYWGTVILTASVVWLAVNLFDFVG